MRPPIVAGVDGSRGSRAAAHYAARLAARRQAPLELVRAYESLHWFGPLLVGDSYTAVESELRSAGERHLADLATEVRQTHPRVQVSTRMAEGPAPKVLIGESGRAAAIVVGSHGAGGFMGLLLGSVSAQVAAHGQGTVVVVRPATDPGGPVLLGYDGSYASVAALNFAVEEALAREVPLVVANIYHERLSGAGPGSLATAQRRSSELLADALKIPAAQHPDLTVRMLPIHSWHADDVLLKESASAGLTVVGCRGRSGFAGLRRGSVSRALVHHAASPVTVIHTTQH